MRYCFTDQVEHRKFPPEGSLGGELTERTDPVAALGETWIVACAISVGNYLPMSGALVTPSLVGNSGRRGVTNAKKSWPPWREASSIGKQTREDFLQQP